MTFLWANEDKKSFDSLKHALTGDPVLGYPNFTKHFILETDNSVQGLGAVLSQMDAFGICKVIAYAGKSLPPSGKSMKNNSLAI